MAKRASVSPRRTSAKENRLIQWGKVDAGGPGGITRLLAMDISSTNVGWCVMHDLEPHKAGTIVLPDSGDRDVRLRALVHAMDDLLWPYMYTTGTQLVDLDGLCYEAPALTGLEGMQFNMIAQAQAVGIVKAAWLSRLDPERDHSIMEVPIQHGKSALAGHYAATKEAMLRSAEQQAPTLTWTEHSADAFGIGLAAFGYLKEQRQVAAYERQMREEARA